MFEDLRNAFRKAVDNFNDELKRERVPEAVDKLLAGMRDEVADAKVRLKELEDQIARALQESEREKSQSATARRRGEMARKIDDEETATVALEYAAKHDQRVQLLEKKAVALQEELSFRRNEVEEMLSKVKEAQAQRESLKAAAGRSEARESLGAADDLFAEMDRMADKISGERARADAAEAFDDLDLDGYDDTPAPPPVDVEDRLAELKRKMGRE